MDSSSDEQRSRNPSMQPIQSLMACADEEANDVELHSKEVEQGELRHADPSIAIAYTLPVVDVIFDHIPAHEVDNHGPVASKDEDTA